MKLPYPMKIPGGRGAFHRPHVKRWLVIELFSKDRAKLEQKHCTHVGSVPECVLIMLVFMDWCTVQT